MYRYVLYTKFISNKVDCIKLTLNMNLIQNSKKWIKRIIKANDLTSVLSPLFFLSEHICWCSLRITQENNIINFSLSLSGFLSNFTILIYYLFCFILTYKVMETHSIESIIFVATAIQIATGNICVLTVIYDRLKNGHLAPIWFKTLILLDNTFFNTFKFNVSYKRVKFILWFVLFNSCFIIFLIYITNYIVSRKFADAFYLHRAMLVIIPMTQTILHALRYCSELCVLADRFRVLNQLLTDNQYNFQNHNRNKNFISVTYLKQTANCLDKHNILCEMFQQLNDIHGLLDFASCLCLLVLSIFTIYSLMEDFFVSKFDEEVILTVFTKMWWLFSSHGMCLLLMKSVKICTMQVRN